jgi:hypothetical protein
LVPDGKSASLVFSDEGGEYQLVISRSIWKNKNKTVIENPTFIINPSWFPIQNSQVL